MADQVRHVQSPVTSNWYEITFKPSATDENIGIRKCSITEGEMQAALITNDDQLTKFHEIQAINSTLAQQNGKPTDPLTVALTKRRLLLMGEVGWV